MEDVNNFGGITTEKAGNALREALKQVQEDPYYQLMIFPMMGARIRYDESWRGKLFPYSPLDRLKREILILKIISFGCIGLAIILLFVNTSLITTV